MGIDYTLDTQKYLEHALKSMCINKDDVLMERQMTHGDFSSNSTLTMDLFGLCKEQPEFSELPKPIQFAIFMILHKTSRAICGDHKYTDHWVDIQGYASLAMKAANTGGFEID